MNVLDFAEEFTRLVIRYTKTSSLKIDIRENTSVPLTKQEITKAVNNVLHTLFELSSETYDSSILLMAQVTPKIKPEQSDNSDSKHRLSDTQSVDNDLLSNTSSLPLINEEEKPSFGLFQDEKKFISRSSPAIYVNSFSRSDTFTRDENKNKETNNQESIKNSEENISMSSFLQLLNNTQEVVMTLVSKLDNLKKQMIPQHMQSLTLNDSLSDYIPTKNKTTMHNNMRKSITAFSTTSSRSFMLEKEDFSDRRKSISPSLSSIATSRKQNESINMNRSSSNLCTSTHNKSPSLVSRPAKNPKYAHVQSTIPKASGCKRKPQ